MSSTAGIEPSIDLSTHLDMLPVNGVREFVRIFALQHGVSVQRTRLDDWADAVASLSGDTISDTIKQDHTLDLLVALRKKKLISVRQMGRLVVNYMNELKGLPRTIL